MKRTMIKQKGNLTIAGIGFTFVLLSLIGLVLAAMYTVDEGHVGVVKRWGEVVRVDGPGLHFKMPIRDGVEEIDVRPRKSTETLAAATFEQMPATVAVSFNWSIQADNALKTYKAYGGLPQFEDRILDPMMRSTAKGIISRSTAEELIQNRSQVVNDIQLAMTKKMEIHTGVTIGSVQIENIDFPPTYMQSIKDKQVAKNEADKADEELRKQNTESRQQVNTANAERDSNKARADGEAYAIEIEAEANAKAIRLRGLAEAEAILAQAKALEASPIMVDYIRAKQWNGQLPSTIMGGDSSVLWQMK